MIKAVDIGELKRDCIFHAISSKGKEELRKVEDLGRI